VDLSALGWTTRLEEAFAPHAAAGLVPARVAVEHRSRYELLGESGEWGATLAGRLRHEASGKRDRPAVGDWVACEPSPPGPGGRGSALVVAVLPRHSAFVRGAAGREGEEQVVAANVDVVFIVTSLNAEFSARRLERYLALGFESGARPVVVLSKTDLVASAQERARLAETVRALALDAPVVVTSAVTGEGIAALTGHLDGHRTGALLGSSGVGKSTLVNRLAGFERQATAAVREADARGRHTTARRELIVLPGGGILIDTPGMRELQLTEAAAGLEAAFADIEALAAQCSFRDCTHGPEPGCAVKEAAGAGGLAAERVEAWRKLVAELAHHERQTDRRKALAEKARVKAADRAFQKVKLKARREGEEGA
jgi:ribosome biogenesis GTPase